MNIIYTDSASKKTSKQKAKEKAAWQAQNVRDGLTLTGKKFETLTSLPGPRVIRDGATDFRKVASVDSGIGNAVRPADKVYTGTAMIGVAQLHKSNAVPVFSQQDAIDISKMRRG